MILDFDEPRNHTEAQQKKHRSGLGGIQNTLDHESDGLSAEDLTYKNRAWCGALFDKENPPKWDEKQMKYLCFSPEICPNTQKFHWQWYVYFKNAKSLSTCVKYLQRKWSKKANVGTRAKHGYKIRGTPAQNRIYCGGEDYTCKKTQKFKKKNPEFQEFGEVPKQGERVDLQELTDAIMSGKTTADNIAISESMAYHQYGRTLEKVQTLALRKQYRKWMTKGFWYWGGTGVGKSHTAFKNHKEFHPDTHYIVNIAMLRAGFWDGYKGQEIVIINEFRGQLAYGELLDLVDKWPKMVNIKGKEPVPFLAKTVIITGPKPPEETYKGIIDKEDSIQQLERRFVITELTEDPVTSIRKLYGNKY